MRPEDFRPRLIAGHAEDPSDGMSLLQVVGYLADGSLDPHPGTVHPVLGTLAEIANDYTADEYRTDLARLAPLLIDTSRFPIDADDRAERDLAAALVLYAVRRIAGARPDPVVTIAIDSVQLLLDDRDDDAGPGPGTVFEALTVKRMIEPIAARLDGDAERTWVMLADLTPAHNHLPDLPQTDRPTQPTKPTELDQRRAQRRGSAAATRAILTSTLLRVLAELIDALAFPDDCSCRIANLMDDVHVALVHAISESAAHALALGELLRSVAAEFQRLTGHQSVDLDDEAARRLLSVIGSADDAPPPRRMQYFDEPPF